LRLLGVPGNALPDGLEERAEIFRALLAERRVMIVLDNAEAERQILPLLPGNPASAVIVTSRSRLAGLPGAIHMDLDVFDPEPSTELLGRIVGAQRVTNEADAAADLVELCGRLPLALRIAGARLSARPNWSVTQLVARLQNDTRRLDELKHGDMGIRASISLSYESLSPWAQRLFRRLAILDFPSFSAWVSAAILDRPLPEAQDVLDDLTDAQLVETVDAGPGPLSHYRLHDLIRVFARERLAAEESAVERNETLARVLGSLLFLAESAHRREYGDAYVQPHSDAVRCPLPPDLVQQLMSSPRAWFERERVTLVSGIRQAARVGFTELCWDLAISAVTLFESRAYLGDWRESHEIALAAVRRARDRRGEAAILYSFGSLGIAEHHFDEARRCLDSALPLFAEIGDDHGRALVLRNIGFLERLQGRLEEAERSNQEALATFRAAKDQVSAAYVLHQLAELRLQHEDSDEAMGLLTEALRLSRDGGSRRVEAQVLHRVGHTHLLADEPAAAAQAFGLALTIVRDIGDATGEAYALHGLGVALLRQGELGAADNALRHAAVVASPHGQRLVEALVMMGLGELALASDDPPQAVVQFGEALTLLRELQVPLYEVRTLMMLSDAHAASGDTAAVRQTLADVLPLLDLVDASTAERLRAEVADRLARKG
jgi:tetratricopeptide (TPR) repeat protein